MATGKGTSPDPDEPEVPVTPGPDPEPTVPVSDEIIVTIREHSGDYVYDGTWKTVTGYDLVSITMNGEAFSGYTEADFAFNGTASISGLEVGSYDMNITAADFENLSQIYTSVRFVIIDGVLNITAPYVPPVPPRTQAPHLTVTKVILSTPENEEGYQPGEVITYRITVTNDGTADAENVTITDELTGDTWTATLIQAGRDRMYIARYTVTEEDAENGSVTNVAVARNANEDPDNPNDPGEVTADTIEKIDDDNPPLGPGSAWALVNLIATIGTALTSIILVIKALGKGKEEKDDEEEVDEDGKPVTKEKDEDEEEEEDETKIKRNRLLKILSIVPALAAIITFILTEDMTQPMVLVDKWTILMVIYLLVDLILGILSKKKKEEPEDDDDDEEDAKATA